MASANNKNQGKRIGFAGCRNNTADVMRRLLADGYRIDHLLTVSPEDAATKYHISGYVDLQDFAGENSIPVYQVEDYSLQSSERDRRHISDMGLDLLIVLGWQRIIPKWFLDQLPVGAIGMHGAPKPPPYGRGHSVLNWACIEGEEKFIAYLFFYLAQVDAGPIIGLHEFDINSYDTCESLHFKYELCMSRLLRNQLPELLSGRLVPQSQSHTGATYYPPRKPEDGLIEWNNRSSIIYNLVRGVTAPYPGAFTYLDGNKVTIWSGRPFDTRLTWNKLPGTIVEAFHGGKFIVQTRDYGFLVNEYDGTLVTPEHIGKQFSGHPDYE